MLALALSESGVIIFIFAREPGILRSSGVLSRLAAIYLLFCLEHLVLDPGLVKDRRAVFFGGRLGRRGGLGAELRGLNCKGNRTKERQHMEVGHRTKSRGRLRLSGNQLAIQRARKVAGALESLESGAGRLRAGGGACAITQPVETLLRKFILSSCCELGGRGSEEECHFAIIDQQLLFPLGDDRKEIDRGWRCSSGVEEVVREGGLHIVQIFIVIIKFCARRN